ncbi:MAG: tyrosine-type recombinase/integrase [Hyphomonadaceae bacterium]|nr:tyrosine-type recombinase/integrase [Hyphomonadaceae bacterium]
MPTKSPSQAKRKAPRIPLNQTKLDALKPRAKPYKESDGGGLYVLVNPNGSKLWRLAYRFGDPPKQKTLALGVYDPQTNGLTHARAKREAAKLALKEGRDPGRTAPATDGQSTFETVARAWHKLHASDWAPKYAGLILSRLEDDVFPEIGAMPIGRITKNDIEAALTRVVDRGAVETAHRLKKHIASVFAHAADDVSDPTPKVRLPKRPPTKGFKRLKAEQIGPFLVDLDKSTCEPETRLAMLLTIYTATRTSESIGARWDEFEHLRSTRKALWRLPEDRMKADREHLIPLSRQVIALLHELHERTGKGDYLFPAAFGGRGHMSNNTMLFHCYAMGYRNKTTMHGFRGSFSTIANESGMWAPEVIEAQLAHAVGGKVHRAYNSAEYLPKRRELLQWWADKLDLYRARARGRTTAELLG